MKILAIIMFLFSYGIETTTDLKDYQNSSKDFEVLQDVNNYRQSIGLAPLIMDNYLSKEAYNHNLTMVSLNQASHLGFQNRAERIKRTFPTTTVSECITYNYHNPMTGWLNSTPHKNILETSYYRYAGVSYYKEFCTIILVK